MLKMNNSENLDVRLYMAPLRGVTTAPYRNLFADWFGGVDVALAPFISADGISRMKRAVFTDVLPENNSAPPLIPQLIGKTPEGLLAACEVLRDLGYGEVNWNLGCPWPFVIRKRRGSGLLPHPDHICAVLDRIVPLAGCRISIKARLGTDRPDQLVGILPALDSYPLSGIVIHPRTAGQMYQGSVDLDAFADCLEATRHDVIYNGDIRTGEDFRLLSGRFSGVRGWMLGRGLVADPFLAAEIRCEPVKKCADAIRCFHDELYGSYRERLQRPRSLLGRMKELWFYLSQSFSEGPAMLRDVQRSQSTRQYESVVDAFFNRRPAVQGLRPSPVQPSISD